MRRTAAIAAVLVIAMTVSAVVAEAQQVRDSWGIVGEAVIIEVDVEIGDLVDVDDLVVSQRPSALLPPDVLSEIPSDADVAVRSLRAGEVVTRRDLASTRGVVTLPTGHRAMSVPLDASIPRLEVGNHVELYLIADRFGDVEDSEQPQSAIPALVVEVTEHAAVLAVPADRVGEVAAAQTSGRIVVALR